ncbi:unnamed protein product, partial [Ectocarpus sp. 8 AP-2014]
GGAEEEDDTLELTKGFYSEVAARLGKTAQGQPQDSQETAKDEDSGSEIDKAIYDELRARRDFGFEQVYAPPVLSRDPRKGNSSRAFQSP